MNKLYAFLTIVLLSACGSSGIDGSWSDVSDSRVGIEITGDKAKLTEYDDSMMCPIEGPDQDVYTLVCDDEGTEFFVYLRLDGDILKVAADEAVRDFRRN